MPRIAVSMHRGHGEDRRACAPLGDLMAPVTSHTTGLRCVHHGRARRRGATAAPLTATAVITGARRGVRVPSNADRDAPVQTPARPAPPDSAPSPAEQSAGCPVGRRPDRTAGAVTPRSAAASARTLRPRRAEAPEAPEPPCRTAVAGTLRPRGLKSDRPSTKHRDPGRDNICDPGVKIYHATPGAFSTHPAERKYPRHAGRCRMLLSISVTVVVPKNFKLRHRYFMAGGSFYVLPVFTRTGHHRGDPVTVRHGSRRTAPEET